jgi:hypothetical protein
LAAELLAPSLEHLLDDGALRLGQAPADPPALIVVAGDDVTALLAGAVALAVRVVGEDLAQLDHGHGGGDTGGRLLEPRRHEPGDLGGLVHGELARPQRSDGVRQLVTPLGDADETTSLAGRDPEAERHPVGRLELRCLAPAGFDGLGDQVDQIPVGGVDDPLEVGDPVQHLPSRSNGPPSKAVRGGGVMHADDTTSPLRANICSIFS